MRRWFRHTADARVARRIFPHLLAQKELGRRAFRG